MNGTAHLGGLRLAVLPMRRVLIAATLLALSSLLAWFATPRLSAVGDVPDLARELPAAFGDWHEGPSALTQVNVGLEDGPTIDQPYDQVVMRAYQNSRGQVVFLALAWGQRQRQEIKVHRPDLCYVAQGFRVGSLQSHRFDGIAGPEGPVIGKRMYAASRRGGEAVSYWMRIGRVFSEDAWDTRVHILEEGFAGRIPDGVLVRASLRVRDPEEAAQAWPVAERFLRDLTAASPPQVRRLMLGWGPT